MAAQAFATDDTDDLPKPKSRLRSLMALWYDEHRRSLLCTLLVGILIFLYFAPSIVVFIPAGHGGVLWKRFHQGTQMAPALAEGVHVIFPWDKIEVYDLRLQEDTRSYSAIANDGLNVSIEITVRYRPYAEMLAALHKNVGPNYLEVLLVPEVGSVSREIVSRFKADELYAHRRLRVQTEAFEQVADRVMYAQIVGAEDAPKPDGRTKTGYLLIQDILIRNVSLPDAIMASIERKIQQDQAAQEYQFRLQRELFESQRKQLEGQGIRAFQETVQANLTENYLRWRGIEATLELAHSPNAKIVVIGNAASGGLPLILDAASGQNAATAVAPGTGPAELSALPPGVHPGAHPGAPPAIPGTALAAVPTSVPVPPAAQLPSLSGDGNPNQTPPSQMPSLNTGAAAPAGSHPAATPPTPAAKPEPPRDGKAAASAPILSKMSPSRLLDLIQPK
ncbi:prohibitin family protein [Azospirillum rugosum]|uniref:Regulator of protease activity HflC (Stomatin/prohibitin superfamily) n=1 Tax=Azospirillum rugosum TaxID=416170 RepID=A0ABS4SU46_9PROT|nr:prohibitin family protein [Azospirillum rugosum]MBP2296068.1 regulator of protease activity HflC (stomatin/prohibitin superfamily) [Azospirillum rugosum]MDQ0530749.1 regulator of protease activity HflC (stomatin/prohibitin superfamily) [Azospirillum rugosum]